VRGFFELDRTAGHGSTGYCVPAYGWHTIRVPSMVNLVGLHAQIFSIRNRSHLLQSDQPVSIREALISTNEPGFKPGEDAPANH